MPNQIITGRERTGILNTSYGTFAAVQFPELDPMIMPEVVLIYRIDRESFSEMETKNGIEIPTLEEPVPEDWNIRKYLERTLIKEGYKGRFEFR